MGTTTHQQLANHPLRVKLVREDGAASPTPDDRVRYGLSDRQRTICEAVLRLTPQAGHPDFAAGEAHGLYLVMSDVYHRLHCPLGPATCTGNRYVVVTDADRAATAEMRRSLGVDDDRPWPLYFDHGLHFGSYVDVVMAVTGATEEEVWFAVGLLPRNLFGWEGTRSDLPRTRAAAANR